MSIYSITVNCTYHDSKHITEEEDINKKKDYSYVFYWEIAKFNEESNIYRFWEFYQIVFALAYQANAVTRQAFIQLVSIITKETPILEDENLMKKLLLKLVESICYHYSPKRSIVKIIKLIRIIIIKIKGFAKGSISHIVFTNFKKIKKKD